MAILFVNGRKAMMGAVPELERSFIKVPKILKENQE
jgi:hypothetical protein